MTKSELVSKIDERINGKKNRLAKMSSVRKLEVRVLEEDIAMFIEVKRIIEKHD